MVHGVQHMGKHFFRGGKAAVGNNTLHLLRQRKTAQHQKRCRSHRCTVEKNFRLLTELFNRPSDPPKGILSVETSKTDIFSFACAVGPCIGQQHGKSPLLIVIRQADIVRHPLAGVTVEADHKLLSPLLILRRKISGMELQSVKTRLPHIVMRAFHHGLFSPLNERHVLVPVRACHLHGALGFRPAALHGTPIKIGDLPAADCRQKPCSQHCFF